MMMDSLTDELIKQIKNLPIHKKKALIEMIHSDFAAIKTKISKEDWKEKLLKTSVWNEEDIEKIHQARDYINQWKPRQFS
jgi:hypothetical protein